MAIVVSSLKTTYTYRCSAWFFAVTIEHSFHHGYNVTYCIYYFALFFDRFLVLGMQCENIKIKTIVGRDYRHTSRACITTFTLFSRVGLRITKM